MRGVHHRERAFRVWLTVVLAVAFTTAVTPGRARPAEPALPSITPVGSGGLLSAVRRSGGRVVLVNVWATWCQPCREEMPDLLRLRDELAESGFRLVLVSGDFADQREAAQRFLAGLGVDFPSFIKDEDDMAFIDALDPDWSGALPASFVYSGDGTLRRSWEGKRSYATMRNLLLRELDTNRKEDSP